MVQRSPWRSFVVRPDEDGTRLDAFVAARIPGLSRNAARDLARDGAIVVDGRPARKGLALAAGSTVEILGEPVPRRWSPLPDASVEIVVIYEDDSLVLVDKPAGMDSVPLAPDEPGTLAGGVAARFPETRGVGRSPGDAGLVNRLDRETSGIVIVARTQEAHDHLVSLQTHGGIDKRYLALVRTGGKTLPKRIDEPLAAADGGRRARVSKAGRPAVTLLREVRAIRDFLLVEAAIRRGARHQIRVHLAHADMPIAGDRLYGGPEAPGLERLFLHASRVILPHPRTGERLDVASNLPPELVEVVESMSHST